MGMRQQGFSLGELLICVALCLVLMGVAAPDLRSLVSRQQGDKALAAIARAVQSARSAAITSGQTVTLCRSSDGATCSGNWHDGLISFIDYNRDRQINGYDLLLQQVVFHELPGTISWRAFQNRQYLQLSPGGFLMHQNGNFTYCPAPGAAGLAGQLVINSTGRIRQARDRDGDGHREGSDGLPIRC